MELDHPRGREQREQVLATEGKTSRYGGHALVMVYDRPSEITLPWASGTAPDGPDGNRWSTIPTVTRLGGSVTAMVRW